MQVQFSPSKMAAELNCFICTRPIQLDLSGALANVPPLVKPMIQTWQRGASDISIQSEQIGGIVCVVCRETVLESLKKRKEADSKRMDRIKRKGVNRNGR